VIVACETGNLGSDKVQKMNGCNDFYEVDIFTVIKKGSQHSKVNVCGIEENLT